MFNLKSTVCNAFCALALALSSFAASATVIPTYHVSIDTSAFKTSSGYLDISLGGLTGYASAIATLSNLSGNFGAVDPSFGGGYTSPSAGVFVLTSQPSLAYLSQNVTFGGSFSFDVAFSGDFTSVSGGNSLFNSLFQVFTLNSTFEGIGSPDGIAVSLNLNQPTKRAIASVTVNPGAGFASATPLAVNAVPEPADWLLMLTGLVFVVYMTRLNGRTNARRRAAAAV